MDCFVQQATGSLSSIPMDRASKPWEPKEYQLKAIKHLLERGGAGLFLDPGLGKTSITLACQKVLKETGQGGPMLVLAPLRVCQHVWPAERKKWLDFNNLTVTVLHGKYKDSLLRPGSDVYLLNYEGLDWFLTAGGIEKTGVTSLVCDESTRLKNSQGKRFKELRKHLNKFNRRWILTGTPQPNGFEDLWAQIYLLDGGLALGRYITHFRTQFMDADPYNPYQRWLKPGAADKIHEAMRPYILRMAAEDYLDMPELVYNNIEVELPPEARFAYGQLYNRFITELESGVITAANAAVAGNKCLQITNGAIYTTNPNYEVLHDAKLDALTDLMEELSGKPALIFYQYNHDRERIVKALKGTGGSVIGSGVTEEATTAAISGFNAGRLPWLLAHPASTGHGLNLQETSNHVIWFGVPWDLELYDQAIRRVYRQGNPNTHVFVHHIVAKESIDQHVLEVLASKDRSQKALFRAMLSAR